MILYKGQILENIEQKKIIESLREDCYHTLSSVEPLQSKDVIKACDVLAQKVKNKDFDDLIILCYKNSIFHMTISYNIFRCLKNKLYLKKSN